MAKRSKLKIYEELPNGIQVDGHFWAIDFSFENILRIQALMKDDEYDLEERFYTACEMLFDKEEGFFNEYEPKKLIEMFKSVFDEFINEKEEEEFMMDIKGNKLKIPKKKLTKEEEEEEKELTKPVMDYLQDFDLIYASFIKDYGIDLYEHKGMHWYKFKALLDGLGDDTALMRVIRIRISELPSGKGSSKARKDMEKAKMRYRLEGW